MKNPIIESIIDRLDSNFPDGRYLQTQRLVQNIDEATLREAEELLAFQRYLNCKKLENHYAIAFGVVIAGIVCFLLAVFGFSNAIIRVFILIAFMSFIYGKLDYATAVDRRFPKK